MFDRVTDSVTENREIRTAGFADRSGEGLITGVRHRHTGVGRATNRTGTGFE